MKKLVLCILVFVESVIGVSVQAQVVDTLGKWHLDNCFQYATAHNIQINTLRLAQQTAEQNLIAAKGSKTPSLSASISSTFNNANNANSNNGNLTNQLSNNSSYSVNAGIVLWNGNYINNNINQKNVLTQSAQQSVQQSYNNIILAITQAYLTILLAKENLKYVADLVASSGAMVQQGQLFFAAGSIAQNNLLQLQAQFAGDKYLLIQTQNAIRQNTLALKQLLQLPTDTLFDILTPTTIDIQTTLPLLSRVEENAFNTFPEIKIGQLGLTIASLDIAKAKAGFKPLLSANGSLGSGYNTVITNATTSNTSYFTQSGNNFYQQLGIVLAIPIFSNRINQTNLAKANIGYQQANLNLQNNQLVLSQVVEQAYLNASNAQQAYVAANEQLLAVTESYRITNAQFKLGAINSFDVLLQRNLYVQAVQTFTQAKYSAVLQQKIYAFYMGKPVTL